MNLEYLLIGFITCEFFEFFWQKGDTLKEYMQNLLNTYQNGVIFFICLHPSLFFILFCIFTLNITNPLLFIIGFLKFADVGFKISLLDKLYNNLPLGNFEVVFKQDYPLSVGMRLIPFMLYVSIFFLVLF